MLFFFFSDLKQRKVPQVDRDIAHSQTPTRRHHEEITHGAVTLSDLPLLVQSEKRPDSGPRPDPPP